MTGKKAIEIRIPYTLSQNRLSKIKTLLMLHTTKSHVDIMSEEDPRNVFLWITTQIVHILSAEINFKKQPC